MTELKLWTKSDFEVKGRRTNSQIQGEADYVYEIFFHAKRLEKNGYPITFTSKARANEWLRSFIKMRNDEVLNRTNKH